MPPLQSLLQSFSFGPEETKAICEAFESAWLTLQKSGAAYANGSEVKIQEMLAKRILMTASRSGLLDRLKLADDGTEFILSKAGGFTHVTLRGG